MKLGCGLLVFYLMGAVSSRPGYGYDTSYINYQPSFGYLPAPPTIYSEPSFGYLPSSINTVPYVEEQKDVYFFTAPEDEPPTRLRVNIEPASQRNTKIIFIKAPSYGGIAPEVLAPPSQSEQKTIIYVLSKKQEPGGEISVAAPLSIKPTKPEVYYIKYKTHKEAEDIVAQGVSGQPVGSGVKDLENSEVFTKELDKNNNGGAVVGDRTNSGDVNYDIDVRYKPQASKLVSPNQQVIAPPYK